MHFHVTKFLNFRPFLVGLVAFQLKNTSHEQIPRGAMDGDANIRQERLVDAVKLILAFKEEKKIPGLAVAISINGRTVLKKGFGYQDLENQIPATAEMRANISSLTKVFTTHLFMKCMLKGRTRLNNDVRSYIPHLTAQGIQGRTYSENDPLPLRWLFIHKSGMRHYDLRLELYDTTKYSSQEEVCRQIVRHQNIPLFKFWPGQERIYSSIGFDIVGAILEKLTAEENFYDLLTKELRTLNLNDTYLHRREDVNFDIGRGYTRYLECNPTETVTMLHNSAYKDYSGKYASEGLVSTVGDLLKFGNLYLRIEQDLTYRRPLPSYMVENMWSNHVKLTSNRINYNSTLAQGITWRVETEQKVGTRQYFTSAFHGGCDVGFCSYLLVTTLKDEDILKKPKTEPSSKKKPFSRLQLPLYTEPFHTYEKNCNQNRTPTECDVCGISVAVIGNLELTPVDDLAKLLTELFLNQLETPNYSESDDSDEDSDY